nr:general transcription factor II-I repeat domain-containing protein 2-like [Penaeus vannamei]
MRGAGSPPKSERDYDGEDIFGKVYQTMEELDLDWSKLASITTDGLLVWWACLGVHCQIHQQALCCKVLTWDSVMKVVVSCINFIRAKGLKHRQFQEFLSERNLRTEMCCTTQRSDDMTEMLNSFNLQLQGQGKLICDIIPTKAFEVKLELLLGQVKKHSFIHLPATQNLSAENPAVSFPAEKCVEALEMLKAEFEPICCDIDEAQPSYQFELAELQNCDVLKDAFKPNSLIDFYAALPNDTYPNIRKHAMKMSTLFGSTYICEQTFSRMKLLKTPMRSRLTDEHLHQCLRLAVTKMEPDIQLLTSQMQAHSSH